jgi:hypothetical protein
MSELWVEIEQLVIEGAPFDPVKGRRVADLTAMALERLLRERGTSVAIAHDGASREMEQPDRSADMKSPPAADEAQWANGLANILFRAIDRRT